MNILWRIIGPEPGNKYILELLSNHKIELINEFKELITQFKKELISEIAETIDLKNINK